MWPLYDLPYNKALVGMTLESKKNMLTKILTYIKQILD